MPRREVALESLRPDLIVVTHRHPDHFDIDSLDRLAQLYPDAVVITADLLVGQVCQQLGFRNVSLFGDWQRLSLRGLDLLTTPSFCDVEEWGVLVATDDGVAWNQVDTELGGRVPAVLKRASEELGRPELTTRLDLVIARWQPLLQVDALIGRATNFPVKRYARELDHIAACNAAAAIPGAAGSQLSSVNHWLNAFAYPVTPERIRRDLAARCPDMTVHDARCGARWLLSKGTLVSESDSPLVRITDAGDGRRFRPFSVPRLDDPDPEGRGVDALRAVIEPWVQDVLVPAVGAHFAPLGGGRLVLEVVYPDDHSAFWTLEIGLDRVHLWSASHPDPDMYNQIAASELAAVIEGRAPWGRPLLSGRLRSAGVPYTVSTEGLSPLRLPPFFLYLALSYRAATERWVAHEVARCLSRRSSS